MKRLSHLASGNRLFTYKVIYDAGSAPNPYHGICTLALCKPAIRRVAKVGDLIAGFESGNGGRLVYCMQVTEVLTWAQYIDVCTGKSSDNVLSKATLLKLRRKIPKNGADPGDCIWKDAMRFAPALPSASGHHERTEFTHDVLNGVNVLLSDKFWYFGNGAQHHLAVKNNTLRSIIPGRGHRSNANSAIVGSSQRLDQQFVNFFNSALDDLSLIDYGVFGIPSLKPTPIDCGEILRCRKLQQADDLYEEEGVSNCT